MHNAALSTSSNQNNIADDLDTLCLNVCSRIFDLQALARGAEMLLLNGELPDSEIHSATSILRSLIECADVYSGEAEAGFNVIMRSVKGGQHERANTTG